MYESITIYFKDGTERKLNKNEDLMCYLKEKHFTVVHRETGEVIEHIPQALVANYIKMIKEKDFKWTI
jgi:hypothetical protein